jgi:hypothetical protein
MRRHRLREMVLHRLHEIMLVLEITLLGLFFGPLVMSAELLTISVFLHPELDQVLHILMLFVLLLLLVLTVYKIASERYERWRLNQILRINRRRRVLIVLSSIAFHPPDQARAFKDYFPWTTPIDGVEGVKRLMPLLERIGIPQERITFKFSEKVNDSDLVDANLFLIGGHEHNCVARQLNNESSKLIVLEHNKINLPDQSFKVTEWKKSATGVNEPCRDYGLVTRSINRVRKDGRQPCVMWAFEGVRHWGTLAGIDVLAQIAQNKELKRSCPALKQRPHSKEFVQFVVSCEVNAGLDQDFDHKIDYVPPYQRKSSIWRWQKADAS